MEKHREIISSALWERKEILQYKHTNGLRRNLKEDCWGIRAGSIKGKKRVRKETGFSGRFYPNQWIEKCRRGSIPQGWSRQLAHASPDREKQSKCMLEGKSVADMPPSVRGQKRPRREKFLLC